LFFFYLLSSSNIYEFLIVTRFSNTGLVTLYVFAIARSAFHSRLVDSWKITPRTIHSSNYFEFSKSSDLRIETSRNRRTFNSIKHHSVAQSSNYKDEFVGNDSLMVCSTLVNVWSLYNSEILIILLAEVH